MCHTSVWSLWGYPTVVGDLKFEFPKTTVLDWGYS